MGWGRYYSGEQDIADARRRERVAAMRERLAGVWLSSLTADYAFDICVVMDSSNETRYGCLERALDRLEARLGPDEL